MILGAKIAIFLQICNQICFMNFNFWLIFLQQLQKSSIFAPKFRLHKACGLKHY